MNIYFKNITLISPVQNIEDQMNIWIKDGIIAHCGKNQPTLDENTEIIDATKYVCSPGLYDMHVHLREPGFEYKENIQSGTEAAANGGFTAVCCMPNTKPCIDEMTVVEYVKQKAQGKLVEVNISSAITMGREGKVLTPMLKLNNSGVIMFTDDGSSVQSSDMMKRAFEYASPKDLLISEHCEDHSLTVNFSANEGVISSKLGLKGFPSVAEEIIISRDIMLAEFYGNRRFHVQHLTTKNGVEIIKNAKSRGLRVSCEVTPHHFSLSEECLIGYDSNYKMDPPLRTKKDIEALIQGLKDGTIDCIASDHAPHALHEKDVEFERAPYGIVGLETSLGVSLTFLYHQGHLSLKQIIEKMSVNPRKILRLPEIIIETGKPANLTIFDPNEEWFVNKTKFKSKSQNSPYEKLPLKGKPKYAVNNNQIYVSNL